MIDLSVQLKWISNKWETMVSWNPYLSNGRQSKKLKPIIWQIYCSVRKRWIPTTLSPLWETLGLMLSKVAVTEFDNPSWLDTWTFWHLVILCGILLDVVCDRLKHTKKCFVTNRELSWAFCIYIPSSASNNFLNTLRQTSKIYLEWTCNWYDFSGFFISK